jgi:hypothetical protein
MIVIKVGATPHRPWTFFVHPDDWAWNWFDFIIVVLSMPGVMGSSAGLLRLLRLLRLVKIFNKIPMLKVIYTLYYTPYSLYTIHCTQVIVGALIDCTIHCTHTLYSHTVLIHCTR